VLELEQSEAAQVGLEMLTARFSTLESNDDPQGSFLFEQLQDRLHQTD
jgi:hypothetical protein